MEKEREKNRMVWVCLGRQPQRSEYTSFFYTTEKKTSFRYFRKREVNLVGSRRRVGRCHDKITSPSTTHLCVTNEINNLCKLFCDILCHFPLWCVSPVNRKELKIKQFFFPLLKCRELWHDNLWLCSMSRWKNILSKLEKKKIF